MLPDAPPKKIKVLVVCLGNICRSPMGEAVLRRIAELRGLEIDVDSAGTGPYHIGNNPHQNTVAVCKNHNIPISRTARQICKSDFTQFTHILASDGYNLGDLESIKPGNCTAEVKLWGSYLNDKSIPDPYFHDIDAFENIYKQCVKLSNAFLDDVFPAKEL